MICSIVDDLEHGFSPPLDHSSSALRLPTSAARIKNTGLGSPARHHISTSASEIQAHKRSRKRVLGSSVFL